MCLCIVQNAQSKADIYCSTCCNLQVMQLSINVTLGTGGDFSAGKGVGMYVYSSLRGTGLLASALGHLAAPAECQRIITALLKDEPLGKRSDHLITGASCLSCSTLHLRCLEPELVFQCLNSLLQK